MTSELELREAAWSRLDLEMLAGVVLICSLTLGAVILLPDPWKPFGLVCGFGGVVVLVFWSINRAWQLVHWVGTDE